MYQFRTYGHLCSSKRYLKTKEECKAHLKKVIEATNEFRLTITIAQRNSRSWGKRVTSIEVVNSIEAIKIDEVVNPEWKTLLGDAKEITDPNMEATA